MKSYLFIAIAMLTAAGAVALTKPEASKIKRAPQIFLRFKGHTIPLSAAELTDSTQWEYLSTNPGTDCNGAILPCVVSIDSVELSTKDGDSQEAKMADFMDDQSDDGIDYAETNAVFQKDQ